ncbi:MAG: hypothetical protein QOG43_1402 [Actinomycetota bacterium]|jgi:hypothetical protein|nr:hypothetical protein [Actinomycetota bacterium]
MERKQLESAAASNHYLRGLLAIPFGVVWIISAFGNLEWGPFRYLWTVPVGFLLCAGAYAVVMRYYNDNYGRVTPKGGPRAVAGVVASLTVMIGGPILVQVLDLPLNGFALAWGVVTLGYYAVTVGLRAHHLVIWGALLVASLIPLWGDPRTTDTPNFGMLMIGVAAIITGIFDHRLLVRAFGSARDPHLANDNVGA